jgi:hypothetical protein
MRRHNEARQAANHSGDAIALLLPNCVREAIDALARSILCRRNLPSQVCCQRVFALAVEDHPFALPVSPESQRNLDGFEELSLVLLELANHGAYPGIAEPAMEALQQHEPQDCAALAPTTKIQLDSSFACVCEGGRSRDIRVKLAHEPKRQQSRSLELREPEAR